MLDTNEFLFVKLTAEARTLLVSVQVNVELKIQSFSDELICANMLHLSHKY